MIPVVRHEGKARAKREKQRRKREPELIERWFHRRVDIFGIVMGFIIAVFVVVWILMGG